MMSKKDYEAIAKDIKRLRDELPGSQQLVVDKISVMLCSTFKDLNIRFDSKKFLTACGWEDVN